MKIKSCFLGVCALASISVARPSLAATVAENSNCSVSVENDGFGRVDLRVEDKVDKSYAGFVLPTAVIPLQPGLKTKTQPTSASEDEATLMFSGGILKFDSILRSNYSHNVFTLETSPDLSVIKSLHFMRTSLILGPFQKTEINCQF